MANEHKFLVLCSIVIAILMPVASAISMEPKAVEEWFEKASHAREKLTKLHFFFHETNSGNNITSMIITSSNYSRSSPTWFGQVNIVDDPLRAGPEPDSKIIGRAQGLWSCASMEEFGLLMTLNFVFTEGEYNGSTISILGDNRIMNKYREMPVVGGSGVFRLARGIATAQTTMFNLTSLNTIVEYHVVLLHYLHVS